MIYSSCPIFWLYVVSQTHFVRMIMLAILFFSCYYWLSFFFPLHYFYLFKLFKCFFFLLSHKSQGKFIHLSIVSKSNIFIFFFRVTFLFYRVENCIMFFFPQSFANTIEYLCVKDFVFRQQFRKNSLRYFYLIFHE